MIMNAIMAKSIFAGICRRLRNLYCLLIF